MYKEPETAFAVFNFTGESTIKIDDILRTTVVWKRLNYSKEDVIASLLRDKVFMTRDGTLDFQYFKKMFFPHLTLMMTEEEYAVQRKEEAERNNFYALQKKEPTIEFNSDK